MVKYIIIWFISRIVRAGDYVKIKCLWAVILLLLLALGACGVKATIPEVLVDGEKLTFSEDPEKVEGKVLVPGQEILLALFGNPIWDAQTQTLGIEDGNLTFILQAGNPIANINNQPHDMKIAPKMKGEQLLIPLELVVEVLGLKMETKKSVITIVTAGSKAEPAPPNPLVGLWSSTQYFGEVVDAVTGLPVQSAYSGEWYLFREDGTFRYVIVGAGQFISGTVVDEGKYRLKGSEIELFRIKRNWFPDSNHPREQEPAYRDKAVEDRSVPVSFQTEPGEIKIDGSLFYCNP